MNPSRWAAASMLAAAVGVAAAGCGSSSNNSGAGSTGAAAHTVSTASVCKRLAHDLPASASSMPKNLDQAKATVKTEATILKTDTADARSTSLRSAGQTAGNELIKALSELTRGSAKQAPAALRSALTAAERIKSFCPAIPSGSSSSSSSSAAA